MNKKIAMISLGCAKNRINSEQMMYKLSTAGYEVTGDIDGADVVIINTCGFVKDAKSEAIETILEMAEQKATGNIGKIIVTGCLAERYKDEILEEMPEIDAIAGTGSYDEIVTIVKKTEKQNTSAISFFGDRNAPVSETKRIITTSPVWTYLKIAEGCDNHCAYCTIPSIRGNFRSRPTENIVAEAIELAAKGFDELVLVAQDTTAYGRDLYGKRSLNKLLTELEKISQLKWIRLMYLYPDGFDDALIDEISKSDKIVKYLDIPIQHSNDRILQKMNRRGSNREIRELFLKLRERIDGIVLRTGIITGLPGEGEREFKELCDFMQEIKFERAGVFAYSPEEGTPAAKMKYPREETALERAEILREIQAKIMTDYNKSRIGSSCNVLIEGMVGNTSDEYYARSYAEAPEIDGYIKVISKKRLDSGLGNIVKITSMDNSELVGTVN